MVAPKPPRKVCPKCGWDMLVRVNRETGTEFLGCGRWPECQYTEPMPESYKLRRMGAVELPGFESV